MSVVCVPLNVPICSDLFKFGIYCKRREVRELLRSERGREEKKGKEKVTVGLKVKTLSH